MYIAYIVFPGVEVREVGRLACPYAALELARSCAEPGCGLSVNREDVPQPNIRASEVLNGVGSPLTQREIVERSNAQRGVELASGRWERKRRKREQEA